MNEFTMDNPYENGTPKYSTAQSILEALQELQQTEEMGILLELGADVSWENQGYYYFDKGAKLAEQFDNLTDRNYKMWLIDIAIFQLDGDEIHGLVYEALRNEDMAKRIGFKKIFIEHLLLGDKKDYDLVTLEFADELGELNRFGNYENMRGFEAVMNRLERPFLRNPYPQFAWKLCEKVGNLRLHEEKQLVIECRALLTSYDDFIYGLRVNQCLYEQQEKMYQLKVKRLQASYDEKVTALYAIGERQGIFLKNIEQVYLSTTVTEGE